jgi:nitrite reductase/ring-hydroxylating ferredoxin subunit
MIINSLIFGPSNVWEEIYDPSRKVKQGLSDFIAEQVDTLSHYADWIKGSEVDSAEKIPPGQGAVIQDGLKKIAAFRDENGMLHALSAKCTHLGCVVHWNSAEKSWGCPCHGSRFAVTGEVLHGPAPTPLEKISVEDKSAAQFISPGIERLGKGSEAP